MNEPTLRRAVAATLFAAMIAFVAIDPAHGEEGRGPRLVAMTFDDLPFAAASESRKLEAVKADRIIRRTLARRGVPATGFVTEDNVRALGPDGAAILSGWLRDGLDLGNHGAVHADTNDLDMESIRQEILAGEKTLLSLAGTFGRPVTFYRFAYNHVGDTEERRSQIEGLLAERGYRLAASTIDTSDYLFDRAHQRAASDPAMRRRIERAYLDHSRKQIRYYQALNRLVLGREPPAIMLLHSNVLNAMTLDRLIAIFRAEGFRFVSLTQAQEDKAYRTSPAFATRFGPMWGYRWARERGVRVDGNNEQEPPNWLSAYAETGVVADR
ncbi:MAG: polysaccharide deacetylase family protein [Altererythrobacter sp.]|nr:polysaccharide deacetylase family protein [Altererythrobacter sp.]